MATSDADPSASGEPGFAVWLTGRPAAGKSTIARALADQLRTRHVQVTILDSDELRKLLTPQPTYSEAERDLFYGAVAVLAAELCRHGICVLIAATANRRAYRDLARAQIARFMEVLVDCPTDVLEQRDFKGLYSNTSGNEANRVPGRGAPYEPPEHADLVLHSDRQPPQKSAQELLAALRSRAWIG